MILTCRLYEEEGKTLRGPMALARRQLGTYHDFVLSIQNENYLWHPKFFLFKGASADAYDTLYSSGHILRWLLLSLPDKKLEDPRVSRAVAGLASTISRVPTNVNAGTMTDRQLESLAVSLHALSIYNQRVFGDEPDAEATKERDQGGKAGRKNDGLRGAAVNRYASFKMYACPAGIRLIAWAGQCRAIAHWLHCLHNSWLICRNREPFPSEKQPSTHFPQPMQRFWSMMYSKYGVSTSVRRMAFVGQSWFSAPVLRASGCGSKKPVQRSQ